MSCLLSFIVGCLWFSIANDCLVEAGARPLRISFSDYDGMSPHSAVVATMEDRLVTYVIYLTKPPSQENRRPQERYNCMP